MVGLLKRRQQRGKRRQPLHRNRKLVRNHGEPGKPLVLGRQQRPMSLPASGAVHLELAVPTPRPCRPSHNSNDGAQLRIGV